MNIFKQITEIYILIPSLLGLKGNLEMTLASRLSTQANIGNMDKKNELKITMHHFEEAMKKIRPLSVQEISMYAKIAERFGKPSLDSFIGKSIT